MSHLIRNRLFLITRLVNAVSPVISCSLSISSQSEKPDKKYKLLIVGGGTGGTSVASKFAKSLQKDLAVIEPSETHYYQSMFTLVGGGIKQFNQTLRKTEDVLPEGLTWIKDLAVKFDPQNNLLITKTGKKIKGLEDALEKDDNVVSIYSPKYVQKVLPAVNNITSGTALFTFPTTPVKCAGAGQKICYLSEERLAKAGLRSSVFVKYRTGLPVMFPVPHYAQALEQLADGRKIQYLKGRNLVEVRGQEREAVFEVVGEGRQEVEKYTLLHVTPPMAAPKELWASPLVDESNFVKVNKESLQHDAFPNVFALGDCTNAPTSKTAAACASQVGVVSANLKRVMQGREATREYNGYTSCPLTVSSSKVILAEFGYGGKLLETFPFDQRKPSRLMFFMKAHLLPFIYWNFMLKGMWHGPAFVRKLLRLGL